MRSLEQLVGRGPRSARQRGSAADRCGSLYSSSISIDVPTDGPGWNKPCVLTRVAMSFLSCKLQTVSLLQKGTVNSIITAFTSARCRDGRCRTRLDSADSSCAWLNLLHACVFAAGKHSSAARWFTAMRSIPKLYRPSAHLHSPCARLGTRRSPSSLDG